MASPRPAIVLDQPRKGIGPRNGAANTGTLGLDREPKLGNAIIWSAVEGYDGRFGDNGLRRRSPKFSFKNMPSLGASRETIARPRRFPKYLLKEFILKWHQRCGYRYLSGV